jgi:hypothetical protein
MDYGHGQEDQTKE